MNRSSPVSIALFALLGAVLVAGIVHLFQLRFSAGDIYPAYSSYRADPRGTRVLFESIGELPEVEALRNVRPLDRREPDAGTTLLFLGVNRRFSEAMVEEIERHLAGGARVVIGLYPFQEEDVEELRRLRRGALLDSPEDEGEEEVAVGEDEHEDLAGPLGETFGYGLRFKEGPEDRLGLPLLNVRAESDAAWSGGGGPDFWLSRLYLEPEEEWEVFLRLGDEAVGIQRAGDAGGALIVLTDSYWLSNEAMSLTRRTPFVAWLLGSSRTIIFDETHLGIAEHERLSHLMRRLNLEMLLGTLLILAILFIWKNGIPFPPRVLRSGAVDDGEVQGHDSQKGLVKLLRANVSRRQIFPLCWKEWMKTLEPAERVRLDSRIEAATEVVDAGTGKRPGERELISQYRKVTAILNERKNVCKPQIQTSKD